MEKVWMDGFDKISAILLLVESGIECNAMR